MEKGNDIPGPKWELLLTGKEQDLYDCFHRCYDDLYRLGIYLYKEPELVKESIQLLFIELWGIRHKLQHVNNIRQYVLSIYKRVLFKQKTNSVKHWSNIEMIDDETPMVGLSIDSYEELLINSQAGSLMRERLLKVLPQLGERQKELIRMRYFEEKSIDEIAVLTTLAPRTIYNTLHNALGRLREMMT